MALRPPHVGPLAIIAPQNRSIRRNTTCSKAYLTTEVTFSNAGPKVCVYTFVILLKKCEIYKVQTCSHIHYQTCFI